MTKSFQVHFSSASANFNVNLLNFHQNRGTPRKTNLHTSLLALPLSPASPPIRSHFAKMHSGSLSLIAKILTLIPERVRAQTSQSLTNPNLQKRVFARAIGSMTGAA